MSAKEIDTFANKFGKRSFFITIDREVDFAILFPLSDSGEKNFGFSLLYSSSHADASAEGFCDATDAYFEGLLYPFTAAPRASIPGVNVVFSFAPPSDNEDTSSCLARSLAIFSILF